MALRAGVGVAVVVVLVSGLVGVVLARVVAVDLGRVPAVGLGVAVGAVGLAVGVRRAGHGSLLQTRQRRRKKRAGLVPREPWQVACTRYS